MFHAEGVYYLIYTAQLALAVVKCRRHKDHLKVRTNDKQSKIEIAK